MYSKYSIKELRIGQNLPIKLRLVSQKKGALGAVRKLTDIFCQRLKRQVYGPRRNKENRSRTNQSNKMIPIRSLRSSQQKYVTTNSMRKEDQFSQFFQFFHKSKKERREQFKPYHLQENYKARPSYGQTSRPEPMRKNSAVVRRDSTKRQINGSNWQLEKWETVQENQLNSFFVHSQEYPESTQ